MRNSILFFLILFLVPNKSMWGQKDNLFDYSHSVEYANYLYNAGEFKLASSEFKRILFMAPKDITAATKIHDCYIRSSEYKKGLQFSLALENQLIFNDTLSLLQGKLLLLNHEHQVFDDWLDSKPLFPDAEIFLRVSEAMFNYDWQLANEYVMKMENTKELYPLIPLIKSTSDLSYKKPALGAMMSAIIPGSGKAYSGYWKDGLFSLLFVGVAAWQSYNGFNRDGISSKYGWIMAGIGFSLYTGNIYGGAKAAAKKNHETNHRIIHEYEKAFINTYSRF